MIKAIGIFFCLSILFAGIYACTDHGSRLNGEVIIVNDIGVTDTLRGEKVTLDGPYFGIMSIVDSLAFFFNPRASDYSYSCYNLNNGQHIADFCNIGRGPEEFINITPIMQIYEEDGQKKSLFTAANEEKMGIFNITRSVLESTTIFDTVIDLKWRDMYTRPFINIFINIFRSDACSIFAFKQPSRLNLKEFRYSFPEFLKIDIRTGKKERTYKLFDGALTYNPAAEQINGHFFSSLSLMAPDRSKRIVMFMEMLAQINILDPETGIVKGFRIAGTPDFGYFKGNPQKFKTFTRFSDVDEKHIYWLYCYGSSLEVLESVDTHFIYVFDWEGNFVRKLYLEHGADQIRVDTATGWLYAYNFATMDIYRYKLPVS